VCRHLSADINARFILRWIEATFNILPSFHFRVTTTWSQAPAGGDDEEKEEEEEEEEEDFPSSASTSMGVGLPERTGGG